MTPAWVAWKVMRNNCPWGWNFLMIETGVLNMIYKVPTTSRTWFTGRCRLTCQFRFCCRWWCCWFAGRYWIFCFKSTSNCLSRMEHHKQLVSSREVSLIPRRPLAKSPQRRRTCWPTIIKLHIRTTWIRTIGWTFTQDKVSKRKLYNFASWRGNVPGTISGRIVVTLWVVCAAYFAASWERNCFLGTNCRQKKGACECRRISIACSGRLVAKIQCHIEQRESSRGAKKTREGWVMLCNQLLLFPTRPKPHSLFHYAATMVPLAISLCFTD